MLINRETQSSIAKQFLLCGCWLIRGCLLVWTWHYMQKIAHANARMVWQSRITFWCFCFEYASMLFKLGLQSLLNGVFAGLLMFPTAEHSHRSYCSRGYVSIFVGWIPILVGECPDFRSPIMWGNIPMLVGVQPTFWGQYRHFCWSVTVFMFVLRSESSLCFEFPYLCCWNQFINVSCCPNASDWLNH